MHTQRNTHAQVWIRLLQLPQEYWMEQTLREITSVVGAPLLIDNATSKRLFGHYARILVDMDFSRKIFHEIVVEREGYAFTVEVAYEWLLDLCSHYRNLGHDVTVCRRLYPLTETPKEHIAQGKKQVPEKKVTWLPVKDNPSGIGSSLAFGSTKQNVSEPLIVEEEMETFPPPQQQSITTEVPVQQTNEDVSEPIIIVEETKTVPQPQHQSMPTDVPVTNEVASL